jgi:hypothetical protein
MQAMAAITVGTDSNTTGNQTVNEQDSPPPLEQISPILEDFLAQEKKTKSKQISNENKRMKTNDIHRRAGEEEIGTILQDLGEQAMTPGTDSKISTTLTAITDNKYQQGGNSIKYIKTTSFKCSQKVGEVELSNNIAMVGALDKVDEDTGKSNKDIEEAIPEELTKRAHDPELYKDLDPAHQLYTPKHPQGNDIVRCSKDQQKLWRIAETDEIASLIRKRVLHLTPKKKLPKGTKLYTMKTVYKIKTLSNGRVERFKTRNVLRGFEMGDITKGTFDTYAPCSRQVNVRALIAASLALNQKEGAEEYEFLSFDVSTAFLNSDLKESWDKVYVQIPEAMMNDPMFEKILRMVPGNNELFDEQAMSTTEYCMEVRKGLYGMKESAALWGTLFLQHFEQNDWNTSLVDRCLLTLDNGEKRSFACCHVDDSFIAYPISMRSHMQKFAEKTSKKFDCTFDWNPQLFVGITITRLKDKAIKLSLGSWIEQKMAEIEEEMGISFTSSKPVRVPISPDAKFTKLTPEESKQEMEELDPKLNWFKLMGILQYARQTCRPDLSYACTALSQHQNTPSKAATKQLYRTLQYLKETKDLGLIIGRKPQHTHEVDGVVDTIPGDYPLQAFADSNFADDPADKNGYHSVMSYLIFFQGSLISWNSWRSKTVSMSTYHAEVTALREATKDVVYMRKAFSTLLGKSAPPNTPLMHDRILDENQLKFKNRPVWEASSKVDDLLTVPIWEDNAAAHLNARNVRNFKTNRYIEIDNIILNENHRNGTIEVRKIGTNDNPADIGTKALAPDKFEYFRSMFMAYE